MRNSSHCSICGKADNLHGPDGTLDDPVLGKHEFTPYAEPTPEPQAGSEPPNTQKCESVWLVESIINEKSEGWWAGPPKGYGGWLTQNAWAAKQYTESEAKEVAKALNYFPAPFRWSHWVATEHVFIGGEYSRPARAEAAPAEPPAHKEIRPGVYESSGRMGKVTDARVGEIINRAEPEPPRGGPCNCFAQPGQRHLEQCPMAVVRCPKMQVHNLYIDKPRPALGALKGLEAKWRAQVDEGRGPTDRLIGIEMCADELDAILANSQPVGVLPSAEELARHMYEMYRREPCFTLEHTDPWENLKNNSFWIARADDALKILTTLASLSQKEGK